MPLGWLDVQIDESVNWSFGRLIVGLLGGLALFLYGIEKMSDGLRAVAGERLKAWLGWLTSNRLAGVATGALVTAIVQSSSLTTVLVVGFISAGLMTLQQSVGVIMGANVGTTLTAQVAAFKLAEAAWLLLAIGFGLMIFNRRDLARQLGSILLGLGLLFLALEQMSGATRPLRSYAPFLQLMQQLQAPAWGILTGAVFTAVVQSSSATTAVIIALASQGLLALPAALALMLGANLGTCVTAIVAAWDKPLAARQAAMVHLLFNLLGVLGWVWFLPQLGQLVEWSATDLPRQFANAHTIFNLSSTLLLVGFAGPLAHLAQLLVRVRASDLAEVPRGVPQHLDRELLESPALALDRVRLEIGHLGSLVMESLESGGAAAMRGNRSELQAAARRDNDVNQLYLATVDYSRQLAREQMTAVDSQRLDACFAAANYLENAGDIIATNLVNQGLRRLDQRTEISPATLRVLLDLHRYVRDSLATAVTAFVSQDPQQAAKIVESKEEFARLAEQALDHLRHQLLAGGARQTVKFQMEVDLVAQYQRLHYIARKIAKLLEPTGETAEEAAGASPEGNLG